MKSRASLLVWASGCLAGQTNEQVPQPMHRSAMRSSSFFASWTVYDFLMAMGDSCMGHEFVQRPQRMHAVVAGCSMASLLNTSTPLFWRMTG